MGLKERFTRNSTGPDDERPPKPDNKNKRTGREMPVYTVSVEYVNGDTETFECYTKPTVEDGVLLLDEDVTWKREHFFGTHVTTTATVEIPTETLARRPEFGKERTELWMVRWEEEAKWREPIHATRFGKEWCHTPIDESYELECVDEDR